MNTVCMSLFIFVYNATFVLCYSDDVCVLSASGTAAVVSVRPSEVSSLNSSGVAANLSDTPEGPAIVILPKQFSNLTTSIDRPDYERQAQAAQFKQEVNVYFLVYIIEIL